MPVTGSVRSSEAVGGVDEGACLGAVLILSRLGTLIRGGDFGAEQLGLAVCNGQGLRQLAAERLLCGLRLGDPGSALVGRGVELAQHDRGAFAHVAEPGDRLVRGDGCQYEAVAVRQHLGNGLLGALDEVIVLRIAPVGLRRLHPLNLGGDGSSKRDATNLRRCRSGLRGRRSGGCGRRRMLQASRSGLERRSGARVERWRRTLRGNRRLYLLGGTLGSCVPALLVGKGFGGRGVSHGRSPGSTESRLRGVVGPPSAEDGAGEGDGGGRCDGGRPRLAGAARWVADVGGGGRGIGAGRHGGNGDEG